MNTELLPLAAPGFARTRAVARQSLQEFVPRAGRYARDRNHVLRGHANVSRLSPAIRHRLVTEDECVDAVLNQFAASTVEKLVQEVYWRRYWKAWLSLRPQVWNDYLADLERMRLEETLAATRGRAAVCEAGEGPIAIMNHLARELVLLDRPEDLAVRSFATGGFFPFWKKCRQTVTTSDAA